jgi:hypothetical protein
VAVERKAPAGEEIPPCESNEDTRREDVAKKC